MVSHQALEHLHLHRIVHRDVKDRPGGGWGDGVESPGHQKCQAGEKWPEENCSLSLQNMTQTCHVGTLTNFFAKAENIMLLDDPGKTRRWHIKVGRHVVTWWAVRDFFVSHRFPHL